MSQKYPGGIISKTAPVPTGPYENGTAPGVWTLEQQAEFVKQGIWPIAGNVPNYIEDVFSTWLYTGNGSTQTITNGIDLAGEGGLVVIKARNLNDSMRWLDTNRGTLKYLESNNTNAEASAQTVTAYNSDGFSLGTSTGTNNSGTNFASWTFREQPKFFDVVTWSGNGAASREIPHALGSTPGCVIAKRTNNTSSWSVYHRGVTGTLYLNLTNAAGTVTDITAVSATTFTVDSSRNASGSDYVAYLFAHDSGGFGLTGTDNVISCGSYTGTGALQTITLGYEPQWLLIKNATTGGTNWSLIDCIRSSRLLPNLSNTEDNTGFAFVYDNGDGQLRGAPTANGFQVSGTESEYSANGATYIYIAIRRPMKTPTTGTSVFTPVAYTGTNVDNRLVDTGIVTDMVLARIRTATSAGGFYNASRMVRGGNLFLETATTAALNGDADSFMTPTVGAGTSFSAMNGFGVGNDATRQLNQSSTNQLAYAFRRAPGFFDEVCYTGTGSARTVTHNLAAVPELMIVKSRSAATDWPTYTVTTGVSNYIRINEASASAATANLLWNSTAPTSTVFSLGTDGWVNGNGTTYVAYLFASCPGVSKVGSFTGTGATQVIDCGFTGGARFVLIKATSTTGDWYVWDSARGIVAGNDPYLLFNSTAAEVTNTDWVDTAATGFELSNAVGNLANTNGVTYIFLAIA
jgi:hypothetical protein